MDDLAAWLTEIWDEAEKPVRFTIELTEQYYSSDEFQIHWGWARLTNHRTSGGGGASMALGAPSPSEVLARIAADRGLLAEALKYQPGQPGYGMARQAMKFLASTYADRPGYQEAWKPEA